jgi:hypothetical protein
VNSGFGDSADELAGQPGVRGWDTQASSIGKIGLDRHRLAARALDDAHGNGEESRRGRQPGATI